MSRAERLLKLMQCLRRHRYPVSGAVLASELGISLRTLYRDIAALQAQGAQCPGQDRGRLADRSAQESSSVLRRSG
ncbi:MAG: HTH domain-containing protein, partial [Betaproteobacteria bacterium]|nr:HTH domain-containing protein [Betaproteobacteria bacterium]